MVGIYLQERQRRWQVAVTSGSEWARDTIENGAILQSNELLFMSCKENYR